MGVWAGPHARSPALYRSSRRARRRSDRPGWLTGVNRRALDWLNAEGIHHLQLFQAVQISYREQALRFRQFVETRERLGA
jgi:hypothetical protein